MTRRGLLWGEDIQIKSDGHYDTNAAINCFHPPLMGKGGAIGGRMSVLCGQFVGDFELRFGPNDTLYIGKL
jgi:hypothetical protein